MDNYDMTTTSGSLQWLLTILLRYSVQEHGGEPDHPDEGDQVGGEGGGHEKHAVRGRRMVWAADVEEWRDLQP